MTAPLERGERIKRAQQRKRGSLARQLRKLIGDAPLPHCPAKPCRIPVIDGLEFKDPEWQDGTQ